MMGTSKRVLLVDDHHMVASALKELLEAIDDSLEVWIAIEPEKAKALFNAIDHFDLAMVDLTIRKPNDGLNLLDWIKHRSPSLPVSVVSAIDEPDVIEQAFRYGAIGYLPKSLSPEATYQAILLMLSGERYIPSAYMNRISLQKELEGAPYESRPHLTKRQLEVAKKLRFGLSNKSIANELGIAEGTVKLHISAILRALDVENRTQAIVKLSDTFCSL